MRTEPTWTSSFAKWWRLAIQGGVEKGTLRMVAKEAYLAGAAHERIARVRDCQRPMCAVTSLSGALGEPLGCGFKQDHAGPHSWASLPTFLQSDPPAAPLEEQTKP